ncbi:VOC family protein [Planobispora siamensis]|uniref:VOC domain-containing protein n=1 Tax=Planobispora siamensis TaxID=936338 RepID=A0A8J3SQ46_9ACTN|nr:VOC family protein [Planobispora siamensis]GIH96339.1 hypothetical protein Psi01_69690 [Planobispora siamensis]
MKHAVVHWEIGGPDHGRLRDFYTGMFGWPTQTADENYTLVQPEQGPGGGIMRTGGTMPAYVTFYVEVDDLDKMLDRAVELGGARAVPPTKIGEGMEFALFTDPAGNLVGLMALAGE